MTEYRRVPTWPSPSRGVAGTIRWSRRTDLPEKGVFVYTDDAWDYATETAPERRFCCATQVVLMTPDTRMMPNGSCWKLVHDRPEGRAPVPLSPGGLLEAHAYVVTLVRSGVLDARIAATRQRLAAEQDTP